MKETLRKFEGYNQMVKGLLSFGCVLGIVATVFPYAMFGMMVVITFAFIGEGKCDKYWYRIKHHNWEK